MGVEKGQAGRQIVYDSDHCYVIWSKDENVIMLYLKPNIYHCNSCKDYLSSGVCVYVCMCRSFVKLLRTRSFSRST